LREGVEEECGDRKKSVEENMGRGSHSHIDVCHLYTLNTAFFSSYTGSRS